MNDFKSEQPDNWAPFKFQTDLGLAQLLYQAKKFGFWRQQGYNKFSDYCAIALKVKPRKAQILIHIYKKLVVEFGIDFDRIAPLPWSKVGIISRTRNLNRELVTRYLEVLCDMTQRKLTQFLNWYCRDKFANSDGVRVSDVSPVEQVD